MAEHLDHTAPRNAETVHAVLYGQLSHWNHGAIEDGRYWWQLTGRRVIRDGLIVTAWSGVKYDGSGGRQVARYDGRVESPERMVFLLRRDHGFAVDAPVGRAT